MKEIRSIIDAYNTIDFSHTKAALATVARVEGSSYRRTGARMLVLDTGTYLGGISGGCLEGDALRRAQKAIVQEKPSIVTYDTTQDDGAQIGVGLGCNGIIDVLFTPLKSEDANNPVKLLSAVTATREPRVMVAITGCAAGMKELGKTLLYENDDRFLESFSLPEIGPAVLNDVKLCLAKGTSATMNYTMRGGEAVKIFIEVILPLLHLVAYGGGYDVYPLGNIAREVGWHMTVVTNIQKAGKPLFSAASEVLDRKGERQPVIDDYSAVVLMAHDYRTDFDNLQRVLQTGTPYIGMLGPRTRVLKMYDALEKDGKPLSKEDILRIYSPAGLDIGAGTPEEIALSICAEIKSVFANRNGLSLRLREGKIHPQ